MQLADPVGYVRRSVRGRAVACGRSPSFAVSEGPGAETWENESWRRNGMANVWRR